MGDPRWNLRPHTRTGLWAVATSVLIVIVGVQVGEEGIGVGLSGELRIEVLVPLLQEQVVLVEGLGNRNRWMESDRERERENIKGKERERGRGWSGKSYLP